MVVYDQNEKIISQNPPKIMHLAQGILSWTNLFHPPSEISMIGVLNYFNCFNHSSSKLQTSTK